MRHHCVAVSVYVSIHRRACACSSFVCCDELNAHADSNIYFHHPDDPYTTHQRLGVMFAILYTLLAANAMFWGREGQSPAQDISISIVSSLLLVPLAVVFPAVFTQVRLLKRIWNCSGSVLQCGRGGNGLRRSIKLEVVVIASTLAQSCVE